MENTNLHLELYCAKCQEITPHEGYVDDNGEYVFHCMAVSAQDPKDPEDTTKTVYHHFVKFPADTTDEQFVELVQKHQDHNEGQIHIDKQNKKLAGLINAVTLANAKKTASDIDVTTNEAQPQENQPVA